MSLNDLTHDYFAAQFLIIENKLDLAVNLLDSGTCSLRKHRADPTWRRLYLNCASLYAYTLDQVNNVEESDKIYNELVSFDPNEYYIGDYAVFLYRKKRQYDKAETLFKKAIELFQCQCTTMLKYAVFLRYVRRDNDAAQKMYLRAIEVSPNAEALGTYASFLHSIHDIASAESYYHQAIQLDSTHANNLCNYGLLLYEEKEDFTLAEELFKYDYLDPCLIF
jgi:Tfp pilus assembly protein PilF